MWMIERRLVWATLPGLGCDELMNYGRFRGEVERCSPCFLRTTKTKNQNKMKIKSNRGTGIHAGKILSFVNGKRVFVHLRSALEADSLGEIAARENQTLLTVSIDNAQKAADHMSEPFVHAKPDDVVVLLYACDETRTAALSVLGLHDA
jgi:hypothetical protein